MTSLKNRNYLNYNIKKWDENVIYPQSIVIIDLNNAKYINDNYGHEEGDEVIKKADEFLLICFFICCNLAVLLVNKYGIC